MPEINSPDNPPRPSLTWALISPVIDGSMPPKGQSSIETIVWDYSTWLKKLGHEVVIIHTDDRSRIIDTINRCRPDIVHTHAIQLVYLLNNISVPVKIYTIHQPETDESWKGQVFVYIKNTLAQYLKTGLYVFVMTPAWRKVFLDLGYNPAEVFVVQNGADHRKFKFRKTPLHENRSIYLGLVTRRKRQHLYQAIDSVDFVGPYHDSEFDRSRKNYLGAWTRDTVHEHLSDYANLVILSESEIAAPLVVLEALVCGLGVVVSTAASANLDTKLPWITVIPDEKITDVAFVEAEIARNREISLRHREQIREYGIGNFAWEKLVPRYADLCLKLHAEKTVRRGFSARSADTLRRLRYSLPALPSLFFYTARYLMFKSLPRRIRRLFR